MASTGFKSHSDHRPDKKTKITSRTQNKTAAKPAAAPALETSRSSKPMDPNLAALEDDFYAPPEPAAAQPTDETAVPAAQETTPPASTPSTSMGGAASAPQKSTQPKTSAGASGSSTAAPAKSVPGSLAPKPGQPDPNRFGGAPRGGSAGKAVMSYMKKHPKGTIGAIGAIISAFIAIAVAILAIPFQLIHMVKILLDHNFAPGQRIEERASRRIMARVFQEKSTSTGGAKKTTGHPISDKIANMKMDRFNAQLGRDGIKLEFAPDGKLSGIRNLSDGTLLRDFNDSSFAERRTAIGDLVSERIAPWRVLKRVSYTKLMKYHARVSFRFFAKEKVKDIRDRMFDKVRKGAAADELVKPPADPAVAGDKTNGTGQAADAVNAATDEFSKSHNKVSALKAGTAQFRSSTGRFFGITGVIALVCTIKQLVQDAASKGYVERVDQLMRVGNMLPTIVSQLYKGQYLDITAFGQVMSVFSGDRSSSAEPNDRKGWDQSAAAKRITGEKVDSNPSSPQYNPDFSEAANPNGFLLQKVTNVVDKIFGAIPGATAVCKFATGIFGFLLQAIELVAVVFTAGSAEIIALALQGAAQYVIFSEVLPKILAAAANLAITGTENAVDAFNNSDAGLLLSAQDYQRSYGGRQITDTEQTALVEDARNAKVQIAHEKGWFYRMFSFDNTDSLASNLLMKVPTNPSTAIAAITSVPRTFAANFGSIMFGSLRPSYAAPVAVNPYSFQFYGLTQAEIDKYPDPIDNEKYLAQQVPGQSDPALGGKTRLSVLGDNSEYSPEDGDDPNTGDLLHCFINKYRSPEDLKLDTICNGIGSVTAPDNSPSASNNPGDATVAKIYAAAGLNATIADDFLRYRLQLFYTHLTRGVECASTNEDCFKGKGSAVAGPPTGTLPGGVPAADVRTLAQQILANTNVTYWTNNGVNTRDVFLALAAGQPAYTTCANANGAKPDVNPKILQFILEAASQTKVMVNALTDKCHVSGSTHYSGQAVDLDVAGSGPLSILNPIAAKYGGIKNSETNLHHYDFLK